FDALSYAKPLCTLAGNALCLTHCPTQNHFALLLEMLFVSRILLRKTASHFCWKCSLSHAFSYAKPLRTFAGNALDRDLAAALLGDGDYRRANRHVILEVRPAGGRVFVVGCAAVPVPILAAIAGMLDSHEGGLVVRREERSAKLAAHRNPVEQL